MIKIKDHPGYGLTVEACTANAKQANEDRIESFRRCDTDGFLSQYASNISAHVWQEKASIVHNGGYSEFVVLVDSDGTVVSDRSFTNKYGTSWLIFDEHQDRLGRKWVPYDGSHVEIDQDHEGEFFVSDRSRIQKKLGLTQELRQAQAWVCVKQSTAHAFPLRDNQKRLQMRPSNNL